MASSHLRNLHLRDESDETIFNDTIQENDINTLSIQNMLLDENKEYNGRVRTDDEAWKYRNNYKKRKKKRKKRKSDKVKKQPTSQPYIRIFDGEERICFKYNTKISETALNAMPRTELEDNEFYVRFDLETVDITNLNEKFKMDNCVYPRANVPFEMYTGNRWEYETECNMLSCQFVSLNPILL